LLADSFFDIYSLAFNLVVSLQDGFVDGVIIVVFYKSEASWFASVLFCQTSNGSDFAKLFKILSNIIFSHVLFEASDENFLYCLTSLGLAKLFSGSCPFGFNRFSIDGVRTCFLACIDFFVF